MIDAPYLAAYRAWEDQGIEAERLQGQIEEIDDAILGDGKWSDYPQITEQVSQRVCDQVYDEAPRFVEAMYYAHSKYASAEKKAKALAFLADFAVLIDDIYRDEVSDEAEREIEALDEAAQEAWELRHVD